MARMSIDDSMGRDPRVVRLAKLCGWSRRETMGCLFDVWAVCYDRIQETLPELDIDTAAERDGFAKLLIEVGLGARRQNGRVRVSGAEERIRYLAKQSEHGRIGGLKSAESRRNHVKGALTVALAGPQGSANPSASVPSPAPAPAPVSVSPPDPEKNKTPIVPKGDVRRSRSKPKPSEPTADERSVAMFVLSKLGQRSGVKYSGAPPHIRLITARLREGYTEQDLRKVIGYCAVEKKWAGSPDFEQYLRPETLFGPQTIAKYIDHARAWFEKTPGLAFDERPKLEAVP